MLPELLPAHTDSSPGERAAHAGCDFLHLGCSQGGAWMPRFGGPPQRYLPSVEAPEETTMEIVATLMAGLIVLIVVSGLTARFLFKPRKPLPDLADIQRQLSVLGEQQEALAAELRSLREAQEFQARLLEAPHGDAADN